MTKLLFTVFVLSSLLAQSQSRFSVEFRPSFNFGFQTDVIAPGGGFEGTVAYRFAQRWSAFASAGRNTFINAEAYGAANRTFIEKGYAGGVQYFLPFRSSKTSWLFRGGLVYNRIDIEDNNGYNVVSSDYGLGWQAEVGLAIPISRKLVLYPGVRYQSVFWDIQYGTSPTTFNLNYSSLGCGITYLF